MGCHQLEGAEVVDISLQHPWAPGPSPWQVDPIPHACPKEMAAWMKWLCLDGALELKIRYKKRLSIILAEWLCFLAGVCFHWSTRPFQALILFFPLLLQLCT